MLFKDITIIDENYDVVKNTNILVEDKVIKYIGDDIPIDYKGEIYNGNNKVAMPGFFNTHCHVPMTLLRGYGEGLPLERWLKEKMFPFESLLTNEDCYYGALLGISEMIKSGVVSFTDMYSHLEAIITAVEETGIKANISNSYLKVSDNDDYFKHNSYKETEFIKNYVRNNTHDRIKADVSIHAEYTSSESLVKQISEYCNETDMNMHIHLSETETEQRMCKEKHGVTPAEYFYNCGTFKSKTTAAHCVYLEGNDFDILKENGVTVSHCPSSNLKLGSGIAPLKAMMEKGLNITIGTDGAASNNNLNMLEEVNLTAMLHKGANRDPLFLGQKDMLSLACKNGALSQGREDTGSIKIGNRADIVIYDFNKPHMQPVFDEVANILYSSQASDICLTMIDGKIVYKDGIFTSIDMEKVYYNVNRIKVEKLKILK